jgi:hypothetical protein
MVKRDVEAAVEERSLEARTMPAGYTEVRPGTFRSGNARTRGLYSSPFGTCIGIVVTGASGSSNGANKFVGNFHMSTWAEMRLEYAHFIEAVLRARLMDLKIFLYQVDTTLAKDPTLKKDPNMIRESAGIQLVYTAIKARLEALTSNVHVVTHSWGKIGEIAVTPAGGPSFSHF